MGILDRMSQVLRANINDLLNHAEDPEKMLNQILADMEEALKQGKSQVAEQIAQEKMIQSDLDQSKKSADEWGKKAELAVSKSADDLAREALRRQNDYAEQSEIYQKQLEAQHQAVQRLKADLQSLESKYGDARRNKDALIARSKRAEAQKQVAQASAKISSVDYSSDLTRMERRIREQEARVAAMDEIKSSSTDDQFEKLGDDSAVEDQLAALKKKMGK